MIKLGCGTVLFREYDLEISLEAIRNIGFEYFETQAVGPWCPHIDVYKDDPERLVQLKNKLGFRQITGLWSLDGNIIANENSVSSAIRTIEWAAAADIPIVHIGDGHKPQDMSTEKAYHLLEERLSLILEAARKHHVQIAIEPHGTFSLTADGLRRIMDMGDPTCLGINYDGCNIFRAGYVESGNGQFGYQRNGHSEDEVDVLQNVIDRIIHCHAKDIDANRICVPVGDGLVNVNGIVQALKAANYNGVISVETEGGGSFEDIVALAKKSYEYLNRIINA